MMRSRCIIEKRERGERGGDLARDLVVRDVEDGEVGETTNVSRRKTDLTGEVVADEIEP